jgi:hypothetical protein
VFNVVLTDPLSVSNEPTLPSNVDKSLSTKKLPVFDSIESNLPSCDPLVVSNEPTCPSNVDKSLSTKKLPVFDSIESTLILFDEVYVLLFLPIHSPFLRNQ